MNNLLTRIKDNLLADIHGALDANEKKKPTAMLNQYLRNCEKEITKVTSLIKRQEDLKAQFHTGQKEAHYLAEKRTRQAEIAEKANELKLAVRAKQEAEHYKKQAIQLAELTEKADQDIFHLQNQLEDMKHKLQEMKIKRLELMGRENVAHASKRMSDSIATLSGEKSMCRFEEVEQQIKDLEKDVNSEYERNTFDMRIAQLEKELKDLL